MTGLGMDFEDDFFFEEDKILNMLSFGCKMHA